MPYVRCHTHSCRWVTVQRVFTTRTRTHTHTNVFWHKVVHDDEIDTWRDLFLRVGAEGWYDTPTHTHTHTHTPIYLPWHLTICGMTILLCVCVCVCITVCMTRQWFMHDMSHSRVRAQSICTTRLDAYLKCVQIFYEGSLPIRDNKICKYCLRHTHLIHVIADGHGVVVRRTLTLTNSLMTQWSMGGVSLEWVARMVVCR